LSAPDKVRRIGVLTGGGDCPGLNAVIRAVTKTAIFQHGLEVFGVEDGFLGLICNHMRQLTRTDVSNILTTGGTILGTSNRSDPRHFATGTDEAGRPVFEDVTDRVLDHIAARELDALVCIGGDGTMTGAADLASRGVRVVGVPKTIDNDLMHTEVTFGFQTAVETATEALDRIHTTAASHHRVMIVETMGRNAGWLALHAGIASGSDVILIPEIPFNLGVICEFCVSRSREGKAFTIVCVSEGAKPVGGRQVVDQVVYDSPDPIRLGGVAAVLSRQIAERTHLECRATILGHVQRGGSPCAFDRVLATQFGCAAMELCCQGQWGRVVVMQNGRLGDVPLEAVAEKQRLVPNDHFLIASARSVGTCFGDR
jgi:phosphofructokinase-like protein